jgi:chloride channel protein, CIC family
MEVTSGRRKVPSLNLSVPAFAVVGTAAVVGRETGAAMTAVTMILEMTRDYGIVMPTIVAVAISNATLNRFAKLIDS